MSKEYTVSTPLEYEKNGKKETFWQIVGTAWEKEKGISIKLNCVPLTGNLFLNEKKK